MTSKEAAASKIYASISSASVKLLPVSINSKHPIQTYHLILAFGHSYEDAYLM